MTHPSPTPVPHLAADFAAARSKLREAHDSAGNSAARAHCRVALSLLNSLEKQAEQMRQWALAWGQRCDDMALHLSEVHAWNAELRHEAERVMRRARPARRQVA